MKNKDIKKRVIELSYKYKLTHLGSCLNIVNILEDIYEEKKNGDIFVLSSGHAALAWYCVLEKYATQDIFGCGYTKAVDAEELFKKHGVHPNRDVENGIYVSTGSLGHGIGIAVAHAMAKKDRSVFILLSDGEVAEGSVYESLNVARDLQLTNLHIHVNANGYGAYRHIYPYRIAEFFNMYKALDIQIHYTHNELPFLDGLDAHYYIMDEQDYKLAMEILK